MALSGDGCSLQWGEVDNQIWEFHFILFITTMNFIQRAWLVALRPVSTFVNEKLAKKSGILGRIGRFYAFGPREFGYHPSSKLLAYVNHLVVFNMGLLFHKYSMVKSLTMNGTTYLRSYRIIMFLGMAAFFSTAYITSVPADYDIEEGTNLGFIKSKLEATPINALQHRVSAHYTEINSLYLHEITKKFVAKQKELEEKRSRSSEEEKRTLYARPGYQYVPAHSNYREGL